MVTFYLVFSVISIWHGGLRDPKSVVEEIRFIRRMTNSREDGANQHLPTDIASDDAGPIAVRSALRYVLRGVEHRLANKGAGKHIEGRLRRAGWRLRASEYMVIRVFSGIVVGGFAFLVLHSIAMGVTFCALGFLLPEVFLAQAITRRVRRFVAQMPDALNIIANSMRSGYSFLQAVDVAANELKDPISMELRQLVMETRVDIALEDALANLYSRVPAPEVQLVATAVLIQRQAGGNLAGLLEQVGETIRMRLRFEGEVRALTAQGRLSGWIIGLLPLFIAGAIALMNPSYVGLLVTEPLGRVMIGIAAVMEVVGALITAKMVRMEI